MRYTFLFLFVFAFACKSDAPKTDTTTATEQPEPKTTTATTATKGPLHPSISEVMMKNLWEHTDFIDFNYYSLPISMSMDNKPAIQNILSHLEPTPVALPSTCKPTGRIFFQKEGEDLEIAEFYLHQDCRCFVFLKDGKPAHSNRLSDKGLEFYRNSIRQAVQQTQQQNN